MEDIEEDKACSLETLQEKARSIDLGTKPPNYISGREFTPINTWFDYFENLLKWESLYMEQIIKYGDSVPAEILVEFENYNQFDNLRNSVYNYKQNYAKDEVNFTIGGFSHLAWRHAHSLMSLPEIYVKHMYD